MQQLISSSQSAFLKGRLLLDAFVAASELVAWGFKEIVEGVAVKVNFKKAYDRVNQSFSFKILKLWGFNAKWCRWIGECICNAKVAVLVNGTGTNWIKTKRGVRQGDPLSPYL